MHEYYSISELTREFSITTRTLRYYEDEGLIIPFRRGRTRLYTQTDRHRLKQILRSKRLNFSLSEIFEILKLNTPSFEDEDEVKKTISIISQKRKALKQMQRDIDDTLHELERIEENCFERLVELGVNR